MTPVTIKNVPSDIPTLTKLLEIVKRRYKTKGCPGVPDKDFLRFTAADTRSYPHLSIDKDGHLFRSCLIHSVSVEARNLLFPDVRKELTA